MDNKNSTLMLVVVAAIGAMLGYGIRGAHDAGTKDVIAQLDALSQEVTELAAGSSSAVEQLTADVAALSDTPAAVEALSADVDTALAGISELQAGAGALQSGFDGLSSSLDSRLASLDARVSDGMTALEGRMSGMSGQIGDAVETAMAALPAAAAAAAPQEPAPDATAAAAATGSDPDAEGSAEASTLVLGIGETGTAGDQSIFVSRIVDGGAEVMVAGLGMAVIEREGTLDLSNGCTVSNLGVEARKISLGTACTAPAAAAAPATAESATLALGVGQTKVIGDARVFLSRVNDFSVNVQIEGAGDTTLDLGSTFDLGNGCNLAFKGSEGRTATLETLCQ